MHAHVVIMFYHHGATFIFNVLLCFAMLYVHVFVIAFMLMSQSDMLVEGFVFVFVLSTRLETRDRERDAHMPFSSQAFMPHYHASR